MNVRVPREREPLSSDRAAFSARCPPAGSAGIRIASCTEHETGDGM
jgi:hypothetical protein